MKVISIFFFSCVVLWAKPNKPPSYEEGKNLAKTLIDSIFPRPEQSPSWEIHYAPKGKRILRKIGPQGWIYYYQYQIKIPLYRNLDGNVQAHSFREETFFLVIQPQKIEISFLREDLLPGHSGVFLQ
ncbi:MAG: hypothetical protein RMI35_09165 [Leptospiraceae bacterium]|nr:hypothetical protein [Leptospiraceae bacterium]